jgi:hypothetical protein
MPNTTPPVVSLVTSFNQLSPGAKKFARYSHITQKHGLKTNVGRGIVEECWDYRIVNRPIDGDLRLQEWIIGRAGARLGRGETEFHTARNQFMPGHRGVLNDLAQPISRNRFLKNHDADGLHMGLQPEPHLVQDEEGDWYSP